MTEKQVWINGTQQEGLLSVNDAATCYGFSLFETMHVVNKEIPLLPKHLARLEDGMQRLGLAVEPTLSLLKTEIAAVLDKDVQNATLRLTVTAGEAGRGYALVADAQPSRIIQLFAAPEALQLAIRLGVSDVRLPSQPLLAGLKHSSRIENVIAKRRLASVDAYEIDDLLMLDQRGNVVESLTSNLIMIKGAESFTPEIIDCGVAGVMRAHLLERWPETKVLNLTMADLLEANELLLSNGLGIRRVQSLNCDLGQVDYRASALGDAYLGSVPW